VIQRITDRQATQVQAAPATNRASGGAGGLR
jgi:hypothetical protein